MAKQKQNQMKEHILESLHSILMNRHFNKTSFVSTKEKEAGAEANCDPAKSLFKLPCMQDQRETKTLQLGLPKNLRV